MKALLDTNFVVTCVKQKIDFFSQSSEATDEYIEWILPKQVEKEIEEISKRQGEKEEDKKAAAISLEMLKLIGPKKIDLEIKHDNVDQGIVDFLKGKEKEYVLATLDKDLKSKVGCKILTIKGEKSLQLI